MITKQFADFFREAKLLGDINVEPLAGDASSRSYYRVVLSDQSWVLMQWEPFEDNGKYPFLSVLRLFESSGIHVPKVRAINPKEGLVLLEDLGDYTLERRFMESTDFAHSEIFYKKSLDEVIKIHFTATASDQGSTAKDLAFDTEKLLWEMNYAKKYLLEGISSIVFTEAESKRLEATFTNICQTLAKEPMRVVHRDYHSRNIMLKLNQVYVIDFQDARLGAVQYDLVSLFRDSYVDISVEDEQLLLKYYKDTVYKKHEHSFPQGFDEIYELQAIQRTFKACGSFASFEVLREDSRYLKYIQKTVRRLISSLKNFPEYKELLHTLEDSGLAERRFE